MTVLAPMGKLSKKVGIPIALLFLIAGITVWFFPVRQYYEIDRWVHYGANALVSLAGVIGCMGTIAWVLFED